MKSVWQVSYQDNQGQPVTRELDPSEAVLLIESLTVPCEVIVIDR